MFEPVDEKMQLWVAGGTVAGGVSSGAVDRIEVFTVDGSKLLHAGSLAMPDGQLAQAGLLTLAAPRGVGLVGGFRGQASEPLAGVWWHGLPGAGWTKGEPLVAGVGCPAIAVLGTRMIVAGGVAASGEAGKAVTTVEFDAVSPGPVAERPLAHGRAGAAAVVLPGGAVLLAGGVQDDGGALQSPPNMLWMWP